MKLSSILASVILWVYVFLILALLLSSPVEMIRCLWHQIYGEWQRYSFGSAVQVEELAEGRERDVEAYLGCRHFKYKGFKEADKISKSWGDHMEK